MNDYNDYLFQNPTKVRPLDNTVNETSHNKLDVNCLEV